MVTVKRIYILLVLVALAVCAIPGRNKFGRAVAAAKQTLKGKQTVAGRVEQYGPAVRKRLAADFARIGVAYPPRTLALVAL